MTQFAKHIEGNQCNPPKEAFIILLFAKKCLGVDRKWKEKWSYIRIGEENIPSFNNPQQVSISTKHFAGSLRYTSEQEGLYALGIYILVGESNKENVTTVWDKS